MATEPASAPRDESFLGRIVDLDVVSGLKESERVALR
jgi:hypothetical protein